MSKIEELKKLVKISHSEELFGIEEPPAHQCPTFFILRKALEEKHMNSELKAITEIHRAIEECRRWGQGWKRLAKALLEHCSTNHFEGALNPNILYKLKEEKNEIRNNRY